MEQINLSTVKAMAGMQVKVSRKDSDVTIGEPFFDALLEQKNEQLSNDVAPKKRDQSEQAKESTSTEKAETQEKPAAEKGEEEETCDVAREAAAAQIVWITNPNAAQLQMSGQQEETVVIDPTLSITENDAEAESVVDMLTEQTQEQVVTVQEQVVTEEFVVTAPAQEGAEIETGVSEQNSGEDAMEIEVTTAESDETGGESVAQTPLFEGVESAPIKVAEAPARAQESEEVQQQVVQKLSDLLETGETRVQIQLEPVELGKLTIELTRSADGTLNILLDAENLQTRALLEKHIGTLQESLADRGQKVVQITVEHNEEAQRQDNQQRDDLFNGRDGQQKEQQEQQRRNDQRDGVDFLQQLRLGLIPLEEEK